jgi:hypothetical protein
MFAAPVALVAVAALAWAILAAPYMLGRAISRRLAAPHRRESKDGGPVADRAPTRVARPRKNV